MVAYAKGTCLGSRTTLVRFQPPRLSICRWRQLLWLSARDAASFAHICLLERKTFERHSIRAPLAFLQDEETAETRRAMDVPMLLWNFANHGGTTTVMMPPNPTVM